ncbi:MAG: exosortase system-associated protein, TIGR04073 family, partial [Candidatus Omnitrophica bacterium]|nr:exosortase system-associated protein, TIGR04073 family [Candidatus Omnitrophota bacterium]
MKRRLLVIFLATICYLVPFGVSEGFADETSIKDGAWIKLGRGSSNILFGWLEIFRQMSELNKSHEEPIGIIGGFGKGTVMGIARTAIGIYELATFPIPLPRN